MKPNWVPLSPISFLNRSADVYPTATAVVRDDGGAVTYRQLQRRAVQLARAVQAAGVQEGERVAVLANNDLPLLEAHFGIPAAKAVLVALNTRLAPREYAYILNDSETKVLIVEDVFAERIASVREELSTVQTIIQISTGATPSDEFPVLYEDWTASEGDEGELELPTDENSAITINYTSGTTGQPKGAIYSHRGAYLNALGQALELGMASGDVYLWTLPMFHCNGWCFTWAVTAVGARHICLRQFEPARALSMIEQHQVSRLCAAPIVLNAIAHDPAAEGMQLDHEVLAATGGAPPPPAVLARMERLGVKVVHLYGLTETFGPSVICEEQGGWAALAPDERARRMARQGVRTINVEGVRVVDEQMVDVPLDAETMGEIVVRSNSVMLGYLGTEGATAESFRGGWFHTGDLAVRHPDGYIEIRDRAKDIIISGGENISSIEVENVIADHPAVLEVAVVGREDAKWGEVPVAFVTPKPGTTVDAAEVTAWVRDRLAHFKAPKEVVFCDLPKTSTGKIRKTALRERAVEQSPGHSVS